MIGSWLLRSCSRALPTNRAPLAVLRANVAAAQNILTRALAALDPVAPCCCQRSLDHALVTPATAIDPAARQRLALLLARRLGDAS